MNKIFKSISMAAVALLATSCLELEPKDQLADNNLWSTPEDYQLFANQFYGWTHSFGDIVYDGVMSDKRSDLIQDKSGRNTVSNGTNTIPASDGNYSNAYKHIRRCNLLLEHAPSYAQPKDIKQAVGEAYFFRAYSHFELVRLYGDAIIVDKVIDVDDPRMNAKRDNRCDVIDFCISDLKNAAEYLNRFADVDKGRISTEGAYAFLSRVALYEGTWQKFRGNTAKANEYLKIAADAARQVIDSKSFSLFYNPALGETSQKYMFLLEDTKCNPAGLMKKDNTEYIFSRCYDEKLYRHNLNLTVECLNNAQVISRKMANMYLCSDGLPITKSPKFQGYDKMTSEWTNRDNRMRYTMSRPGDAFFNNSNPRTEWTQEEVDAKAAASPFRPGSATRYFAQKWATERGVESRYESYDYPIIRYAEVLLNYAEATYELNENISDADLDLSLNLVRCRINPEMPKLSNALVNANGLDMREEIRRERTVEFFNEGFRLDDLKRWKTAEIEMPMPFLGVKWTGTEYATRGGTLTYPLDAEGCIIYEDNRVWEQKHYLYPLPLDQLQLNPNLGQNPGWR